MDAALALAGGIVGYMVFFNVVTALTGAAFGIAIERIQFGFPPSIRLFQLGRTEVRVSPIPVGGHVKFASRSPDKAYAAWPVRALLAIVGPVAAIAVCAIPLGFRAFDEALMAWPQMWSVAAHASAPVDIDDALRPSLDAGGLPAAMAVVAVKTAMFNLLPSAVLSGGVFVIALLEGVTGRDIHERLPQWVLLMLIAIPLALILFLAYRIVTGT